MVSVGKRARSRSGPSAPNGGDLNSLFNFETPPSPNKRDSKLRTAKMLRGGGKHGVKRPRAIPLPATACYRIFTLLGVGVDSDLGHQAHVCMFTNRTELWRPSRR